MQLWGIGTILRANPKSPSMKRLVYPIMLISLSLAAAAIITTVLAKTMACFDTVPEGPAIEMAAVR